MNKTIAIIGVDGSGKSTLIEQLQNRFGEKAVTKYMGSVRFEDNRISVLLKKNPRTFFDSFKILILTYKCFWDRYQNALKSKKIVLFDRYVNERYINSSGRNKILAAILYKYLFPKPSHFIYLYCSVETSMKRKDDIPDKDAFIAMKKRFDNFYLNNKDCFCINSDSYNSEELADLAYNNIINHFDGKL